MKGYVIHGVVSFTRLLAIMSTDHHLERNVQLIGAVTAFLPAANAASCSKLNVRGPHRTLLARTDVDLVLSQTAGMARQAAATTHLSWHCQQHGKMCSKCVSCSCSGTLWCRQEYEEPYYAGASSIWRCSLVQHARLLL